MDIMSLATNDQILRNEIQEHMNNSLSVNTRKGYSNDINHYLSWGGKLPANAEMIQVYLTICSRTLKASTVQRRLKALRAWHRENQKGYSKENDPTHNKEVTKVMKGIQKKYGEAPKKARPLLMKDIEIIHSLLRHKNNSLHDCRNLAIILVGVGLALRCSEVVGIKYEHLKFNEKGLDLFIPFSKTDQNNRGETVALRYSPGNICAVTCLKQWLGRSGIKEGYVFRGISKAENVFDKPLDKTVVHNIVKNITEQCLEDYTGYSGHSLRRGFVTIAIRNECPLPIIAKQGRWKDIQTMMGYYGENASFLDDGCSIIFGSSLD